MKNGFLFTLFFLIFCCIDTSFAKTLLDGQSSTKAEVSGNAMRSSRRVGVGLSAAGPLGIGGMNLELNFTPQVGFLAGYGGGSGFQTFSFAVKQVLTGETILPYMSVGYAHWANFGDTAPIKTTTPSYLADRFLSEDEKAAGRIRKDFLYPTLGIQYMQLSGDWAGFSLYAEVLFLVDIVALEGTPTGTIGTFYYF